MVCKNCGKENPEGTRFCAGCGSMMDTPPVIDSSATGAEGAPAYGASAGGYGAAPSGESFMDKVKALWAKREVKLGVAIVAAIIVILLVFGSCGGGASSPEEAAEKCIEAVMDGDFDAMLECSPPQIVENFEDAYDARAKVSDKYDLDEKRKDFEKDNKCDEYEFEIKDKEKLKKDRRDSIEERITAQAVQMAVYADLDEDSLKEMMLNPEEAAKKEKEYKEDYEVEVEEAYEVYVEGKADGDDFEAEVIVVKIDGSWYVWDYDLDIED